MFEADFTGIADCQTDFFSTQGEKNTTIYLRNPSGICSIAPARKRYHWSGPVWWKWQWYGQEDVNSDTW